MSFLTLRILLFTAECLLASILLPLLAFATTRLIRRAALRHLVWLTAFGVLAVLPAVALLLPPRQIVLPVAAPVVVPAELPAEILAAPVLPSIARLPAPTMTMVPMEMIAVPGTPTPVIPIPAVVAPQPLLTVENALLLLVLIWVTGVLWHLGRMTLGGIGLMRLRHRSEVFAVPGAPCEVRLAPASGPATFGILRPLILMPQAAQSWSAARLEAVLTHEAANVRRYDAASQALVRLVCAAYWINPLVWLGAQAFRREAEMAADDAVLAQGMTPSDYAAELLRLAAETRGAVPGIAMAGSALAARVQSVLAENISRKGVTRMDMFKTASVGLAVALLLGTARLDLAMAQVAPASPAPAARPAQAARPAPAAPPARSASPKIDVEINRDNARNVDVEVEAIKARADAAAAQARQRAEAETDPARRAQYQEEAARVAAEAAAVKARADETRQRTAQVVQKALETQQRALEVQQKALEVQQRALEAEARAKADAARRRPERESMLTPLSDEEKALLAAARQQKITVSPAEVDERIRSYMAQSHVTAVPIGLRDHIVVDVARDKLALLQNENAPRAIEGANKPQYRVSEIFLAVDRPEDDARVKAEMEVIEKKIRYGESFRGLAQQYSRSPSAAQGGDIGWVHDGQLDPELNSVVAGLKRGELAYPVRGKGGWYLLGLQDRRDGVARIATSLSGPPGTLPLARLLLPLPPGSPKEAVDNTMRVAMQLREIWDSCATMEKIVTSEPVLKGAVFMNMGDYVVANLQPELQKALAQTKSGEVAMPVRLDAGVEIFARCDKRAMPPPGSLR